MSIGLVYSVHKQWWYNTMSMTCLNLILRRDFRMIDCRFTYKIVRFTAKILARFYKLSWGVRGPLDRVSL